MSKKISNVMKQRHEQAKSQRNLFKETYPEEKTPKYFEFLKNDSPLSSRIISYEVSYQLSYRGQQDAILITPKTFTVYGLAGQEHMIQNNTMNMVLDSKGQMTHSHMNNGMLGAIEDNMEIKVTPRGMEESQKRPSKEAIKKVSENGMYAERLDESIKFTNKKGREGNLKLDVRHFM